MSILTWQNVAQPDFRGTMQGQQIAADALNRSFLGLSDALGKFGEYNKEQALASILNNTSGLTDPLAVRAAIAGADKSMLGSAQFAALDAMLSGRIKQAGDLETNRHNVVMNPLLEAAQVAKNEDFTLRAPLERNEIASRINLNGANAGLAAANTSRMRQETQFAAERQPFLMTDLKGRTEQAAWERGNARTDDADQRRADFLIADAVSRAGVNRGQDVTKFVESLAGTESEGVYRRLVQAARTMGGYGETPALDGGTRLATGSATGAGAGAGGGGGGANRTAQAPVDDGPLSAVIPAAEAPINRANQARSAASSIQAKVEEMNGDADRATGASTFAAAMKDNRSVPEIVASMTGNGGPFAKLEKELTNNVTAVMNEAAKLGKPITAATALAIISRNYDYGSMVLGFLDNVENNALRLNSKGVTEDLKYIKSGNLTETVSAAAGLFNTVVEVRTAQRELAQETAKYQEMLARAATQPKLIAAAEEQQKRMETAAQKFERVAAQAQGKLTPTTAFRAPVGTVPAQADTPAAAALVRSVAQPNPAPADPRITEARTSLRQEGDASRQRHISQILDRMARAAGNTPPDQELYDYFKPGIRNGVTLDELKRAWSLRNR